MARENIHLGYHLVVFVDVLGQGSALSELTELPVSDKEKTRVGQILSETVMRIEDFRKGFQEFFEAIAKDSPVLETLTEDVAAEVRQATRADIRFSHFSDAVVISVPLTSSDEDLCLGASGVLSAIAASCIMQLASLAMDFAVRGGMEIGLGTEFEDGGVYGPALLGAYRLENQVADYPRIVAGPGLLRFLELTRQLEPNCPRDQVAALYSNSATELLHREEDSVFATDFMGSEFYKLHDGPNRKPIVSAAFTHAEAQYEKWTAAGDHTLSRRYAWLLRYMNRRKTVWDVEATPQGES